MLAYHNDPAVKKLYVERFQLHREMDEVIQGTGFDNGRGCFVGCTLNKYDHAAFPTELGVPVWLAQLADVIFEGVPKAEAAQFGTDLLEAIKPGVDLEPVRWMLAIWRNKKLLEPLVLNDEPYAKQCVTAIQGVISYCEQQLIGFDTESAAESAARSAAESAWSAAESAESAWSAAWSARSAAESAWSAAESAWSAAWSARSAAESAESAAWSAAWLSEKEALLGIIRSL
jgi:hypothetical protein